MAEVTGREHPKQIVIRRLDEQHPAWKRVATGTQSEGRGDPIEPAIAPHPVAGELIDVLRPDHDRPTGSHALEAEPLGRVLPGGSQPPGRIDRGSDVDRGPRRGAAGMMVWASSNESGRRGRRFQRRRLFEQFLRSPARRFQPGLGSISGGGRQQARRAVTERVAAGRLKHEDEPGEPRRVLATSPAEERPADAKTIRGIDLRPANGPDSPGESSFVETIDASDVCFSMTIHDPERQSRLEHERPRNDFGDGILQIPGLLGWTALLAGPGCREAAGDEAADRQDGRHRRWHGPTIRPNS